MGNCLGLPNQFATRFFERHARQPPPAPAELLIPDRTRRTVRTLAPLVTDPTAVLLREDATPGAQTFTRARARLASIARPRYFEVSIIPLLGVR